LLAHLHRSLQGRSGKQAATIQSTYSH
jgi:hypothetical protein